MPRWRSPTERLLRSQQRLNAGSLGGRVDSAGRRPVDVGVLKTIPALTVGGDIPFSYAGGLVASTSPRWYAPRALTLTKVFGSLGTAGTSTTTINIKLNGTTVATLSFTSGTQTNSTTTISTANLAADTDYVTVEIATAGTSAANLDVQVRYV